MAYDGEGTIRIPLEEFWELIQKFHEHKDAELHFGVPQCDGYDVVINYAYSSICNPADWSKKPKCSEEWKELEKKQKEQK